MSYTFSREGGIVLEIGEQCDNDYPSGDSLDPLALLNDPPGAHGFDVGITSNNNQTMA